jgi:acetaldehyde/propanal dehydrogenase
VQDEDNVTKVNVALIGSGNIGTDLMMKALRSDKIAPIWMVGIDPASDGLRRAHDAGLQTTAQGLDGLLPHLSRDRIRIAFDATSAYIHREHARRLREHGVAVVDLTPAAVGPYCVPPVNLAEHAGRGEMNVNMVSCGGQATNIDEFTRTTASGIEKVGGARRGKAIIILNPAEPPLLMRDTVHCLTVDEPDRERIGSSIRAMIGEVQKYVPGYRLANGPVFEGRRVSVFLEVAGLGDYLPRYAGNLDIMTAAALRTGEMLAAEIASGRFDPQAASTMRAPQ